MGKFVDLTGQKFGRLTVIERAEDYVSPKGVHRSKWLCECECGTIKVIDSSGLKNGKILSCGCYGRQKSAESGRRNLKDLTGLKFGKLLVLNRIESKIRPDGTKRTQWKCRCDCGNFANVESTNLTSGSTKSCGCAFYESLTSRLVDITGQVFGRLTVIERCGSDKHNHPKWLCECECGNQVVVTGTHLKSNHTVSCGCVKSKSENMVEDYLKNQNVLYEKQVKFDNLLGVNGGKLSYDFYLPQYKCLIECQGRQHFRPSDLFGGEEMFEIQKEHDARKKKYAEENNYNFIEIATLNKTRVESLLSNILSNAYS